MFAWYYQLKKNSKVKIVCNSKKLDYLSIFYSSTLINSISGVEVERSKKILRSESDVLHALKKHIK